MSSNSNSNAIENISLYIPHIFANYTKEDVIKVFEDQCIGNVKSIDFISKMGKDEKVFNAAYIHFYEWYDNEGARNLHERVVHEEKEARIMYDDPWYWIVLENKARKHNPGERKPRINISTKADTETTSETTSVSTPVKKTSNSALLCPDAPARSKNTEKSVVSKPKLTPISLNNAFDLAFPPLKKETYASVTNSELTKEEAEWLNNIMEEEDCIMDELETIIEEDNKFLVQADIRYIQTLEEENVMFRNYYHQYYAEYCKEVELRKAETIKVQALTDIIQLLTKK